MIVQTNSPQTNRLAIWMFNPFMYIAGWQALFTGLTVILVTALIGSTGNVHFDGVLDTHIGRDAPLWLFVAEGFIDWLSMVILLLAAGFTFRGTAFRIIDVFGTQALARWPMLLPAAAGILPANRRVTEELLKMAENPNQFPPLPPLDAVVFAATMIVILVTSVWMVALMYRAYAVSCNLKGAKAIVSFIVCLMIAEVISKITFFMIVKLIPLMQSI
jgi:hypothetical protein